MKTTYIVDGRLGLVDLLIILISFLLVGGNVQPLFVYTPLHESIWVVGAITLLAFTLVFSRVVRQFRSVKLSDFAYLLRRDWATTLGCVLLFALAVAMCSWVLVPIVVLTLIVHWSQDFYRRLNEFATTIFVYRLVWYSTFIAVALLVFSWFHLQGISGMFVTAVVIVHEVVNPHARISS